MPHETRLETSRAAATEPRRPGPAGRRESAEPPPALQPLLPVIHAARQPMFLAWGSAPQLLLNEPCAALFDAPAAPPPDGPLAEALAPWIAEAVAGEAVKLEDLTLRLPCLGTPEELHISLSVTPVRDAAGVVAGAFGTADDVTERVTARETRREVERRLEFALHAGGAVGSWNWNIAEDVVHTNPRFAELFGVDPERAARGTPLPEFLRAIHPDDRDWVLAAIDRAVETGEDYEAEYRVCPGNGAEHWVLARGRCLMGANGRPRRFPGVAVDITERKRAEEALAREQELLQTIIDAIPVMITLYDPAVNLLRLNREFQRVTGWSTAEAAQVSIMEECYPDPAYREEVRRFMESCEGWMDIRMRTRSGAEIDTSWANVRLSDRRQVGIGLDITARREAEDALRANERRLRLALDAASMGAWEIEETAQDSRIDPGMRRLFRLPDDTDRMPLEWFYHVTHPEDRDRVARRVRETWDQGGEFAAEFRICVANEERWLVGRGRVVEDGGSRRMYGVNYDITSLKQAEETLRRSEEMRRLALEGASFGTWDTDLQTGETSWDSRTREIFGIGEEEPAGIERGLALIHPEDRHKARQAFERAIAPGADGRYVEEKRIVRPNGAVRWVATSGKVLFSPEDARPLRMVGVVRDITRRKRSETALAESEARFRTMTEAMPQLVWSTLPDGRADFFNARWYEFTGVPCRASDGQGWLALIHEADREAAWRRWIDSLASGEPYETRFRLRHHSGDHRWVLGRAVPVRDEAGRISRWMGSCTDIHEMERAQEHRKLLIDELNHRVKNSLAIVQGIAQQTFKGEDLLAEACEAFEGRLSALAGAHNLLTREHWEKASLQELAAEALQMPSVNAGRVSIAGPRVALRPKQAVTIAMTLHELYTNALKYGALSNDSGRVRLDWAFSGPPDDWLTLIWWETGGPPVEPPKRRGFGSKMIERALAHELGGNVHLEFHPKGVVCRIGARLPESGDLMA